MTIGIVKSGLDQYQIQSFLLVKEVHPSFTTLNLNFHFYL
jgi:hypothetical protein